MNLTRDEARERARRLTVASYDVTLDLTVDQPTFRSTTLVRFSCTEPGSATFIDLVAPRVLEVVLNGEHLDVDTVADGTRVQLPALAADNELRVVADCAFMNTGEGLHRFVDPVDQETYLYSQFEVADTRRVFAVFEQPDLKGTFSFTVTAPDHWQVVSNSPTPSPEPAGDGRATWRFAPTPRLPSYVTAIVAGPYHRVQGELTSRDGRTVPRGVFCRRSLAEYLDAEEILDLTRRGFAYFEEAFDLAYPFEKFDQLFVPEFNAGAMENAGAVTIVESYVFRSKVPDAMVERRAVTILHELAHMWFGDLVTMRWWDDLWLNESFAEWASTTCQTEATRWESAWTTFGTSEKAWAYGQDQLTTTHPIVAPIRDLEDVEVNFDGITYAKGASVLKQLVAYVGREPFRDGLRAYFAKHAWGNTTLHDLLHELEQTSGRDLGTWAKVWLETAGVNTLRPVVETDDRGLVVKAVIEQTHADGFDTLRPHRLAVGLYAVQDGALVRTDRLELDVDGPSTELPQVVGRPAPDLLLVNDDDLAYAKIRLDERSLATALAHPRGFEGSLPRALVLGAAWDMTRDAEMPGRVFVRLVLASLPGETDSTLLKVLLEQLRVTLRLYVAPGHRAEALRQAVAGLRGLVEAAEAGSDAQLQLVQAYAGLQTGGADADFVRGLLEGTSVLDGLAVDTEMRWALLISLAASGSATEAEVDAERARDNTSTGRERAAQALASMPPAEKKEAAWRRAVLEDGLPNSVIEAVGGGFVRADDLSLLEPYVAKYHEMLDVVGDRDSHAIMEILVTMFYPRTLASQELHDATQHWLDTNPDAHPALRRLVAENRDPVARALKAQARDAEADGAVEQATTDA
jgi:aminopeptidase N